MPLKRVKVVVDVKLAAQWFAAVGYADMYPRTKVDSFDVLRGRLPRAWWWIIGLLLKIRLSGSGDGVVLRNADRVNPARAEWKHI